MMIDLLLTDRRDFLITGVAAAIGAFASSPKQALIADSSTISNSLPTSGLTQSRTAPLPASPVTKPTIVQEALAALDRHSNAVKFRDRIAVVDYSIPSSQPRMQVIDIESGRVAHFLVSHGSGSDPRHTGYLERFSNVPDSNASSQGAYVTSDYYYGKHGRSQRLIGLDPTNNKALARAIVIHGAWYANANMISAYGKLGRSQGCFAVGESELSGLFDRLGQGRMIYSAKA